MNVKEQHTDAMRMLTASTKNGLTNASARKGTKGMENHAQVGQLIILINFLKTPAPHKQ
jgi:hypothetical protein